MRNKMLLALGTLALPAFLTLPAVAADNKPAAWPAESLTGTIVSVDPAKRLVVIKDSSGVPFDIVVSRSTRITSGNGPLRMEDLTADINKSVAVRFIPERKGDMARSIRLNG